MKTFALSSSLCCHSFFLDFVFCFSEQPLSFLDMWSYIWINDSCWKFGEIDFSVRIYQPVSLLLLFSIRRRNRQVIRNPVPPINNSECWVIESANSDGRFWTKNFDSLLFTLPQNKKNLQCFILNQTGGKPNARLLFYFILFYLFNQERQYNYTVFCSAFLSGQLQDAKAAESFDLRTHTWSETAERELLTFTAEHKGSARQIASERQKSVLHNRLEPFYLSPVCCFFSQSFHPASENMHMPRVKDY